MTGPSNPRPRTPKPPLWDRLPKTIPHTRARTSTTILVVLFIVLLWWYLGLRDQLVPEEQQRTGRPPAATSTLLPTDTPAYEPPPTSRAVDRPTVPSSAEHSGSGAPSTTVPGAPSSAPSSEVSTPGGITLPGGTTVPIPGLPGTPTTGAPTSGGAPTTTVAPS